METVALLIKLTITSMAALTVVHYSGIIGLLKLWMHTRFAIPLHKIHLKPLDCHVCLSFWLAVLYFVTEATENGAVTLRQAVCIAVYGLAASAISHFLYKIFK